MCWSFSQLCNPSPEIVNESCRHTYHRSVQNWALQSLWFISFQIHEFRKSLSTLGMRWLWQNKFMNPIRSEQKWFHWFDECASTNPCLPPKLGAWRHLEERTWEIYPWCSMDPEWVGPEVGKAAGCIHQHRQHLSSFLATPPRPTAHGLSLDLVLRFSTWTECSYHWCQGEPQHYRGKCVWGRGRV